MREMKNSGIEWIGEIPREWKKEKIKNATSLLGSGTTPASNNYLYYDNGTVPWIQSGDIYGKKYIYESSVQLTNTAIESLSALRVYEPDFIIIAMYGGSVGNIAISKIAACVNQACCCIKPNINNYNAFMYYWLFNCKNDFLKFSEGGGQPNISQNKIKNQYYFEPPYEEQTKIANYLDQKCLEIDAITKDIQTQIDTLEQYKRSAITEAVTKGLDPDVEMKDSGIEWIGKISSDFRITHLKYVCLVLDGHRKPIAADKRTQNAEKLYDYYGASGVIDQIDGYTIDDDVLLIGEDGANLVLRNLPLIYQVHGKAWINNHAHILKPKNELNYYYAYYMLESLDIHIYITGSAQPKFNQLALLNMFIILPPYKKQCEIAHYLNTKCTEIDEIIAEKNKQLDILADYKKSLIYEYVTGKKEVPSA